MTVNESGRCDNESPGSRLADLKKVVEYQKHIIEQYGKRIDALEAAQFGDPFPVEDPLVTKCQACGLEWSGAMGYVCSLSDCPMQTKVGDFPFGINTGG